MGRTPIIPDGYEGTIPKGKGQNGTQTTSQPLMMRILKKKDKKRV